MLKDLHTEARYVIDSFPVAVCHNTRIPRCKLLTGKAYHGRCASKRCWFYGLKVQVVATSDGVPVEYSHPCRRPRPISTGLRGPGPGPARTAACSTPMPATRTTSAEDLFEEATGNRQQTARKQEQQAAPRTGTKPF
ncbi:MAG: transposase [Hymenobacter sp.]